MPRIVLTSYSNKVRLGQTAVISCSRPAQTDRADKLSLAQAGAQNHNCIDGTLVHSGAAAAKILGHVARAGPQLGCTTQDIQKLLALDTTIHFKLSLFSSRSKSS